MINAIISIAIMTGWLFLAIYIPQILCGYNYSDLFDIINDNNLNKINNFLEAVGITNESGTKIATKYFIESIAISILTLIIAIILCKLICKLVNSIKITKQNTTNTTKTDQYYEVKYLGYKKSEKYLCIDIEINNLTDGTRIINYKKFKIKNDNDIKDEYVNKFTTKTIRVIFKTTKYDTFQIYYKDNELEPGTTYKQNIIK